MKKQLIVNIEKDGDMWCAKFTDFVNLAESTAGFGVNKKEAALNLINASPVNNVETHLIEVAE